MDVKITTPREPRQMLNGTNYVLREYSMVSGTVEKLPVVCVHGIGSFHGVWEELVSVLNEAGHSVLCYDLIGRGDSAYPDSGVFDGAAHVAQLRKLISELHFNFREGKRCKYHVVGHSMGGAITAMYCAQYAEEVQSAVFLAPAGLMSPAGPLWLVKNCCQCGQSIIKSVLHSSQETAWRNDFADPRGELADKKVKQLSELFNRVPHQFESVWQSILQFPLSGLEDEVRRVAESDVSVLLMWGEKDKAVPFDNFNKWKSCFDEASSKQQQSGRTLQFITYKDLAHGLFYEKPSEILPCISSFLSQCSH